MITEINNISYTFRFPGETLRQVAAALKAAGAKIAPTAIKPWTH